MKKALIVEDESIIAMELKFRLKTMGFDVMKFARNSSEAVAYATEGRPDMIFMDILLDGEVDGIDTAEEIQKHMAVPIIFITAFSDGVTMNRLKKVNPHGYLIKPYTEKMLKATIELAEGRHENSIEEKRARIEETCKPLIQALYEKNVETVDHSKRIVDHCRRFAAILGMTPMEAISLEYAAVLHDLGKIIIPFDILTSSKSLTPDQWKIVKTHSDVGARIVDQGKDLKGIAELIRHHHEHYDGNGYPAGLKGKEIPLGARVITIVDAYDVMLNGRPYQHAFKKEEAIRVLKEYSGTQFDPELVAIYLNEILADDEED
jgi:response regulator RpfG family c-di-GMP phosphodiesterase